MSAVLKVRQGSVEHELAVPEATLIGGFGNLVSAWEHASKFVLTADISAETTLDIDGVQHEWISICALDDTPLATLMDDAENVVLVLGEAPEPAVPIGQKLPVVSALDEAHEALSVHTGITVAEIKELLRAAYDGDLDAYFIQIRGSNGTLFQSIKLSSISDASAVLMEHITSCLSKVPEMLRPPIPKALSELRLKLAVGALPKAATPAAQSEDEFGSKTKEKVMKAMDRAQTKDGKQPADMQRLLTAIGTVVITNYTPPAPGKRNGGKFDCKLCSVTNVLGESMDGLIRHVCMPKHRKKWIEHTDEPPSAEELHTSLSRDWVPDKVDETHMTYVAKRTVMQEKGKEKVRKVQRQTAASAIASAFLATGSTAGPLAGAGAGGDMPSPLPFPLPLTPNNAATFGAMLAGVPPSSIHGAVNTVAGIAPMPVTERTAL